MNKYNERMLKNVLEDIREENDIKLKQEAEEAASNPLFANNDDTDRRFNEALKEIDKNKKRKHHRKTLIRVASVFFAILIGLSAVTLSVKGFRENCGRLSAISVIRHIRLWFLQIILKRICLQHTREPIYPLGFLMDMRLCQ